LPRSLRRTQQTGSPPAEDWAAKVPPKRHRPALLGGVRRTTLRVMYPSRKALISTTARGVVTQKVVTWNIRHGGGKRVRQVFEVLSHETPDVVVLTEFQSGPTGDTLSRGLLDLGLLHQASASSDPRRNSVLIAARDRFSSDLPARTLRGYEHRCIRARFDDLELIGVYFPQNRAKAALFDLLLAQAAFALSSYSALVGDFNTGRHYVDESGATFLCADRFAALLSQGWVDAWRERNPKTSEFSWFSSAKNGFRIDHALLSPILYARLHRAYYLHEPRENGVSDHSMLCIEF